MNLKQHQKLKPVGCGRCNVDCVSDQGFFCGDKCVMQLSRAEVIFALIASPMLLVMLKDDAMEIGDGYFANGSECAPGEFNSSSNNNTGCEKCMDKKLSLELLLMGAVAMAAVICAGGAYGLNKRIHGDEKEEPKQDQEQHEEDSESSLATVGLGVAMGVATAASQKGVSQALRIRNKALYEYPRATYPARYTMIGSLTTTLDCTQTNQNYERRPKPVVERPIRQPHARCAALMHSVHQLNKLRYCVWSSKHGR